MKTKLLTLCLLVASLAAFAQGKITISNDSLHLILLDGVNPVEQGYWPNLSLSLMGGPSAGSMTLQTTIVGSAIGNPAFAAGLINNYTFTLVGVGVSTTAFLQLQFFSTGAGSYANAAGSPGLYLSGASPVFTMTTGSFAFNSIVSQAPPGNSTWPDAPISLGWVPEPSTGTLLAIGAGAMFWRRARSRQSASFLSHGER